MGLLESMTGGGKLGGMGGAPAPNPNWAADLLQKRANYAPPAAPNYSNAGGLFGPLMGMLSGGTGADDGTNALLNILGRLNGKLGGGNPGAPQPGATPAPNPRPAPVQFDPQAYLQSRLGGNTPSYPSNIKLPF
jgi:hypothetical protein